MKWWAVAGFVTLACQTWVREPATRSGAPRSRGVLQAATSVVDITSPRQLDDERGCKVLFLSEQGEELAWVVCDIPVASGLLQRRIAEKTLTMLPPSGPPGSPRPPLNLGADRLIVSATGQLGTRMYFSNAHDARRFADPADFVRPRRFGVSPAAPTPEQELERIADAIAEGIERAHDALKPATLSWQSKIWNVSAGEASELHLLRVDDAVTHQPMAVFGVADRPSSVASERSEELLTEAARQAATSKVVVAVAEGSASAVSPSTSNPVAVSTLSASLANAIVTLVNTPVVAPAASPLKRHYHETDLPPSTLDPVGDLTPRGQDRYDYPHVCPMLAVDLAGRTLFALPFHVSQAARQNLTGTLNPLATGNVIVLGASNENLLDLVTPPEYWAQHLSPDQVLLGDTSYRFFEREAAALLKGQLPDENFVRSLSFRLP